MGRGPPKVRPGRTVHTALSASDPDGDPLKVEWVLQSDPTAYHTVGAAEGVPMTFGDAVTSSSNSAATVKMPSGGAGYRLFAYVRDNHGGAAVGNILLFVTGGLPVTAPPAPKAALPLVLYGSRATRDPPYVPSGYMGNIGAIAMDAASVNAPRGKICLQVRYMASDKWGGVVWQSPVNDWGERPGGFDLTGAKKLTFWARGDKGGETVTFQFGLLGPDKAYHDSGTGKLTVTLTPDWKQYMIDLAGQNLSHIKTGFCWVAVASGHPVTFYLDTIEYE